MYFKFIFFGLFLLLNLPLKALNYYWVGGSGRWSEFSQHWATTSGGSSFYNQVPSPFDNVIIDANSFSNTNDSIDLDQTVITCNSFSFSTGNKIINLVGGTPASTLNIYGSLTFAPGVSIDYGGTLIFKSTNSGNTIKQNGAIFRTTTSYSRGQIEFNGTGGSWTLLDSLRLYLITFTNGSLNATGKKIACEEFHSSVSNARTLNLTNASVFIGMNWDVNSTNFTGVFSGSIIEFNSGYWFKSYSGSLNYNTIIVSGNFGNMMQLYGNINKLEIRPEVDGFRLDGDVVVQNFVSFSNTEVLTGNIHLINSTFKNLTNLGLGGNLQLDNTDLSGGNCNNFLTITGSGVAPSIITKTSGIFTLNYVILKDVTAQGGAYFSAQQAIDLGGNIGWNISSYTNADMYWVGGAGNWSDGAHWSFSSGGTPANCVPTQNNNAIFDSHSFSSNGQVVNFSNAGVCRSLDCSSSTFKPVFSNATFYLYGSLLLRPGLNLSGISNFMFLSGNTGNSIDFADNIFPGQIEFRGNGGWTLLDSIYCNNLFFNTGSLNTNGKNINCDYFDSQSFVQQGNRVLNLGSSNITVRSGNLLISSLNLTLNAGTSTLNVNQGQADLGINLTYYNLNVFSPGNFTGDNLIFNNVYFASQINILGNITFDTLTLEEGQGITIREGTTQILNEILIHHSKCLSTEIVCSTGNSASILKPSGVLTLDFVSLRHINATGGAVFNAFNCNDQGGNTGWNITALASVTYYWIGGTGNWTDKQHWSLTSGGTPATCVPNPSSDVIFDENSFSAPMQIVNLDLNEVTCHSMVWKNLNSPAMLKGTTLTLGGNLKLDSSVIFKVDIMNLAPMVSSFITTAGVVMPMVNLVGDGAYTFEDDYYSNGYFIINKGDSLRFNHINFHSSDLYFRNGSLVLDLDSSTFYVGQLGVNWGQAMKVISQGADIFCKDNVNIFGNVSGSPWNFPFNTLHASGNFFDVHFVHFPRVSIENFLNVRAGFEGCLVDEFTSSVDQVTIWGLGSIFENADFASTETIIQNNFTIGHLKIEPGKTLKIAGGKTLFIQDAFEAPGSSGFPIYLLSTVPGTQGIISKPSGISCFDYLYISDNLATGGATFIAGPHSANVTNNTGWNFTSSCVPLIASYETPVCEGNSIQLHATDMGAGASYQWTGPSGFISNDKDPYIYNSNSWNSGIYQVTSGGTTAIVYVTVHNLPSTKIAQISNYIQAMDANVDVFKWFKDGQWVSSQGSGKYCQIFGPGQYYALITSPEGCSIFSDTLNIIDYSNFVAPVEPLFLIAQATSASQINLIWYDNSNNESGFVLERSLNPTSGFVIIDTVSADLITYSDTGLNANTTYYYQIRAINAIGSSPSVAANGTTYDDHIVVPPITPPPTTSNGSLVVPNLITPNGDDLNDSWEIKNLPSDHTVEIFNDLGTKVFESHDYRNDWGNDCQSGIYYYIIIYNNKKEKGWMQVIK